MNNQRRKRLKEAIELMERAATVVEEVRGEEANALNNLPENLQSSEKAENMQEIIDNLDEIYSDMEEKIVELEEL